jgi:hypothetical protein
MFPREGLGFHAVAPLKKNGLIRFSLSGGSHRIVGIGELMWTDGKGKIGGLRFTELAEEIREQIRKWPLESNLRFEAGKAAAPDLPAAIGTLAISGAPAKSAAQASVNSAPFAYAPYLPEFLPPETPLGRRRSRLLKMVGISSLAGVIGVAAYLCYREAREWLASQEGGQDTRTSQGLAPGTARNRSSEASESSEIALVSNANAEGTEAGDASAQNARLSAGIAQGERRGRECGGCWAPRAERPRRSRTTGSRGRQTRQNIRRQPRRAKFSSCKSPPIQKRPTLSIWCTRCGGKISSRLSARP